MKMFRCFLWGLSGIVDYDAAEFPAGSKPQITSACPQRRQS
jgi:hypothetical protein